LTHLESLIEENAETDGQYAVAYALLKVASALDMLGTNREGRANMAMGTTEFIGKQLQDLVEAIRERG
jgi:hypothetical protein